MVRKYTMAIAALVFVSIPFKVKGADNMARSPRELGIMVGKSIIAGDPTTLEGALPSYDLYKKIFRMAATIDLSQTSEDEMKRYYDRVVGKLREEVTNMPAELYKNGFNVKEVDSVNASSEEHQGWTSDVTVTITNRDGSTFSFVLDECVQNEGLWYFHDIDSGKIVRVTK